METKDDDHENKDEGARMEKKKEKGPKISQESKGKEKKGRCQTLEISCVPSLVISTTSKLDHTETKADPKLLLNSFYMYLT